MFKAMAKTMAVVALLSISTSAMAEKRMPPSRTPRAVTGVVNINTATPKQLELLPGVGRKTARLIVDHREKQPFKTPAEILNVKGVGESTWRKVKPYVTVSGPTTLALDPKGNAGAPARKAEPAAALPTADGERVAAAR